jgi:hypothetical protein
MTLLKTAGGLTLTADKLRLVTGAAPGARTIRAGLVCEKSICDNQSHHARESQQCRKGFSDHWPRRMARTRQIGLEIRAASGPARLCPQVLMCEPLVPEPCPRLPSRRNRRYRPREWPRPWTRPRSGKNPAKGGPRAASRHESSLRSMLVIPRGPRDGRARRVSSTTHRASGRI